MRPRPLHRHEAPARPRYRAPATTGVVAMHLAVWLVAMFEGRALDAYLLKVTHPTLGSLLVSPFVHVDGRHLALNLLVIVVGGGILEMRWGTFRFAGFCLLCAAGTSVITLAFAPLVSGLWTVSCGSSGVALGALVALGLEFPHWRLARRVPPLRYLVWIMIFLFGTFLLSLHEMESGPYRLLLLPHVSGVALGMLFVLFEPWTTRIGLDWAAHREESRRRRFRAMRGQVDALLDKIHRDGPDSLTRQERVFLERASRHYRDE